MPQDKIPPELTAAERAHWMKLAPILLRMGVLLESDERALTDLCIALAEKQKWKRATDRKPLIIGANGHQILNPMFKLYHIAGATSRELLRDFGLTPSSRGRVNVQARMDTGIETRKRA